MSRGEPNKINTITIKNMEFRTGLSNNSTKYIFTNITNITKNKQTNKQTSKQNKTKQNKNDEGFSCSNDLILINTCKIMRR